MRKTLKALLGLLVCMNSVLVPVLAEETEPSQEIPQETQIHPDSNDKEGVVVSDEEKIRKMKLCPNSRKKTQLLR